MTEPTPPRWRVTFRRAGDPMENHQTLLIVGPDNLVSAMKEAQMMLADKEGGPWKIQACEELPPEEKVPDAARLGDALERARHP